MNGSEYEVRTGDCVEGMNDMEAESVHAIVADPPYGLNFMGKDWDNFRRKRNEADSGRDNVFGRTSSTSPAHGAETESKNYQKSCEMWATEALRILKPGGHLLAFSGSRTHHRMFVGVEDAGFTIRDTLTWHYGCLSEDTEILTVDGWKGIDEISDSDTVFSYDYQHRTRSHRDGHVVMNPVRSVFRYDHDGPMVHLENDNTDQLLTPNHKVLCQSESREMVDGERNLYDANTDWRYIDAGLITSGDRITLPLGAKYDGEKDIGSKLFAELLGWVIAEGWFQGNAVNISQSERGDDERIRYILGRLGIENSEYEKEREYKGEEYTEFQWYLNGNAADRIQTLIPDEKPTWELLHLPLEQKRALYDGLMRGDGSGMHFYQDDREILEWFQTLCHLIGKQGRIDDNKMAVSVHDNATTGLQGKHLKGREGEYDGRVWCIQTDVGNFFARRNGQIFITGNSGFPKGQDIGKAIDKSEDADREVVDTVDAPDNRGNSKAGTGGYSSGVSSDRERLEHEITDPATPEAERWDGWNSALKPATEFIVMARKPFDGPLYENVLEHGCGALNVDGCRIPTEEELSYGGHEQFDPDRDPRSSVTDTINERNEKHDKGRYPPNLILDPEAARMLDEEVGECGSGSFRSAGESDRDTKMFDPDDGWNDHSMDPNDKSSPDNYGDSGGPSRYFYCPKAKKSERTIDGKVDNDHPTVKPLELMEWLITLVTREDQIVVDPFVGSGTTIMAARRLNRPSIGLELDEEYAELARERAELAFELETDTEEADPVANNPDTNSAADW